MKFCASVLLAVLILLSIAAASSAPISIVRERDEAVISASLNRILADAGEIEPVKVWVFFTDKGFTSLSDYDIELYKTELALTERARTRRLMTRGNYNLVDFYDIPVHEAYINRVLDSGAKLRRILKWFNAITVETNTSQLEQIAALPFVFNLKKVAGRRLPDDLIRETVGNTDLPLISTSLNYGFSLTQLEQINTIVPHELGFAGQNVLVCMMDTGYRQGHVAFQQAINDGRLIGQYDFINNDNNTDYEPGQDAENQPRHGTLTWSTLGGQAANFLYGPAYMADFCLAKTEDVTGEHHSEEDNWAAGAEWADSLGASVISASLGYRYGFDWPDTDYPYEWINGDSTIVAQAADLAASRGIVVATAQGNDGSYGAGSLISPADADSVVAVGAVIETDEITSFSGQGPTFDGRIKPEVCAMGQGTACADPNNMNGFTWASGTSLSTPLVGGASAVLMSVHPNWTPMMVREALMMTAVDLFDPDTPDNFYGWGIADISKAMFYHPAGDIIIDHTPLIYFPSGLDNNIVTAEISGGAGIESASLYWRIDDEDDFTMVAMDGIGGDTYEAIVPGLDQGYMQYYISATDINGVQAVYPFGAENHFFTVYIDSTAFTDDFENGLYYWETEGTNGGWALTAERANSGNLSVADSPYRDYLNNSELTLTSKFEIGLFDAESASVSYMARHIIQTASDYVYFEVSTDGGQNWVQPGPVMTGTELYFEETTVDLANYLGNSVMFRFRLVTDNSGFRDGIHIDDFQVVWDLTTDVDDNERTLPREFSLAQNYPNPFNPSTLLSFELPKSSPTELAVYDIMGRKVATLISEVLDAGVHEVSWDGRNQAGNDVASGIYLYKLTAGDFTEIKRMTLIR